MITLSAPAEAAAPASRSAWSIRSADRSARSTAPNRPFSTVTKTRDFAGTNPKTAGMAPISEPGLVIRNDEWLTMIFLLHVVGTIQQIGPLVARVRYRSR